jgi:cyclic pyranopterin phosphate synthase
LSNQPSGESGKDQHAFFQEQLLELEKERKSFYPAGAEDMEPSFSSAASNSDNEAFIEQMKEWKAEQRQVFGKELDEEDPTGGSVSSSSDSPPEISAIEQAEYEEILEEQKQERDLLFNFSSHERAAWGSIPGKNSMQQILEEVAHARETIEGIGGDVEHDEEDSQHTSNERQSVDSHHESFSHVSEDGSSVHMVDVGHKAVTSRMAHAQSKVVLPPSVLTAFGLDRRSSSTTTELVGPKGPIFATAKIAGIMAAKNTSNFIPLCHPLPLDQVKIDIQLEEDATTKKGVVTIDCTCRVTHKTGVEMEALTGASVAALTIYDMTKAVSHEICIMDTKLIAKTGGKRTVQDGVNIT